jgi:hypothetical protein
MQPPNEIGLGRDFFQGTSKCSEKPTYWKFSAAISLAHAENAMSLRLTSPRSAPKSSTWKPRSQGKTIGESANALQTKSRTSKSICATFIWRLHQLSRGFGRD